MPSTVITLTHTKPAASLLPWATLPDGVHRTAIGLSEALEGIAGGLVEAQVDVALGASSAAAAWGTVTISSGSGAIVATINGVAISVTWATSDANTATLLAAAINASTHQLVSGIVTASASGGVVTITALAKCKAGNAVTLAVSGTGATASGARLQGGAGSDIAPTTYLAFPATSADGTRPYNALTLAVLEAYFF